MSEASDKERPTEEGKLQERDLFLGLIQSFQAAAMQQMGKVMNPFTEKIERDMGHAQMSIEMLEMLRTRTQGNLTGQEARFLNHGLTAPHLVRLLAQLRDHPLDVLPIESHGRGLLLRAVRLEKRRQPLGAPAQERLMARLAPLSLLPLPEHPLGVQLAPLAEDVGMARDHLVDDPANQPLELRAVLALERDAQEHDQEQEIPQLLLHGGPIVARDRLSDFVRFLEH